jgi:cytochrome subunit of sulfide dehydrogenase
MGWAAVLAALAVLGAGPGTAEGQTADARLLAWSCAGCHGPDGRSPGAVPSLNGRGAAAIAAALRAFREGQVPATVMDRIAKGYSDAEIDAVARQIATEWK